MKTTADVLIVGSGAAGLTAALNLAETHKVAVIAKGALGDSASARAQGGIAAVLEEGDSFEAHVKDTMIAQGFEPVLTSPADFATFLKADREQWLGVAKAIGFKRET